MKTVPMTDDLYNYVIKHCPYPHPILQKVEQETAALSDSAMQIAKDQGAFMHMIVKLIGVKRAVEVGCYTGFSALSVASALPEDGHLFSFDINADILQRAEGYAKEAGVANKVTFKNTDGRSGLTGLLDEFGKESFDLAFLDADKEGMLDYFDICCDLVRPNGLIIADNVIWGGSVINKSDDRTSTLAIREFNDKVSKDPRVEGFILHISDGLFLLRKK